MEGNGYETDQEISRYRQEISILWREVEQLRRRNQVLKDKLTVFLPIISDAAFLCDTFQIHDYPEIECAPLVEDLLRKIRSCKNCHKLKES